MMGHFKIFTALLMMHLSFSAWANEPHSASTLQQLVHEFVHQELMQTLPSDVTDEDLQITVSNLDARLNLPQCDGFIRQAITSPQPYGANLTVKAMCDGTQRWSVFVPVKVEVYSPAVVAVNSLARGHLITEGDVQIVRVNTSAQGYGHLASLDAVRGMALKRPLRAGEVLRTSHLLAPNVVKRGDNVVVEARNSGISVVVSGTALAAGQVGDQIKVRNIQSNRVVDAKVVAPGKVEVTF